MRSLIYSLLLVLFPFLSNGQFINENTFNSTVESLIQQDSRLNGLIKSKADTIIIQGIIDSLLKIRQTQDQVYQNLQDFGINLSNLDKKVFGVESNITGIEENLTALVPNVNKNTSHLDRFWVLLAAALVFLMQAGFTSLESGFARKQHVFGIAMKNLVDWIILSVGFLLIGFGLMFGATKGGVFGFSHFFAMGIENSVETGLTNEHQLGTEFFLYQLAFAATAATIVSGALAERVSVTAYLITSLLVGILIYPIFGHWAWGGSFLAENDGWLYKIGFRDFAGSTVVHSIGAWVALAGTQKLGAREGKFIGGQLNEQFEGPTNLGMTVLGVFILWFGWWGFNGGSNLEFDKTVGEIILNTNVAGAVGGLSAFFVSYIFDKNKNHRRDIYAKSIGGVLGGLVAVTACCNAILVWEAVIVGLGAGILHNIAYDLLLKKQIDDPIGVIPVHGACGIWGTLCLALFGHITKEAIPFEGSVVLPASWWGWEFAEQNGWNPNATLFFVQMLGIIVAFIFSYGVAYLFFSILKNQQVLRVSPNQEFQGYTLLSNLQKTKIESGSKKQVSTKLVLAKVLFDIEKPHFYKEFVSIFNKLEEKIGEAPEVIKIEPESVELMIRLSEEGFKKLKISFNQEEFKDLKIRDVIGIENNDIKFENKKHPNLADNQYVQEIKDFFVSGRYNALELAFSKIEYDLRNEEIKFESYILSNFLVLNQELKDYFNKKIIGAMSSEDDKRNKNSLTIRLFMLLDKIEQDLR